MSSPTNRAVIIKCWFPPLQEVLKAGFLSDLVPILMSSLCFHNGLAVMLDEGHVGDKALSRGLNVAAE